MEKRKKITDADTFQETYCENCILCVSNASHPTFCFETIYRDNPEGFNDVIYAKLCNIQDFEVDSIESREEFKDIFCSGNLCSEAIITNPDSICPDDCHNLDACYQTFVAQISEFGDDLYEKENDLDEIEDGEDKGLTFPTSTKDWKRRYGDFDDSTNILSPSAKRIVQTPLPASPDTQFLDEEEENQFYWMMYGVSKKQYFNNEHARNEKSKSRITVFTNRNAEWTRTLKRIFGSK